jgi:hypothetical protein
MSTLPEQSGRERRPRRWPGVSLVAALALAAFVACQRGNDSPSKVPEAPAVRLYLLSGVAGALEPCGCRKDMLGGVDHAAAWLRDQGAHEPNSLVLGAGPMLFADPELSAERRQQDLWKAEALASSFADVGLKAWAPGNNDFAAGTPALGELREKSKAELVAGNLQVEGLRLNELRTFKVGTYTVGVAGLGTAPAKVAAPEAQGGDHTASLARAAQALEQQGAQIRVALLALPRGDALRLAEKVPGFQLIVLGKPFDEGDGNDAPIPPALVGKTLVVQAPNHLQAIANVDFFVKNGQLSFEDGSGLERAERIESLRGRVVALEQRLADFRAKSNPNAEQLAAPEAELKRLKEQLASLENTKPETKGSFFRYTLTSIREAFGSEPNVAGRMRDYYKRVNEHNREAFKDRKPPAPAAGQASYAGVAECSTCHLKAESFWEQTRHAHAYATLEKDHKEFNLDCVSCHVTGYEKPGGSSVVQVGELKNVQCESCHGPGSLHAANPEKPGLITRRPERSVCKSCHHPPHVVDDWDVNRAWLEIIGPGHGLVTSQPKQN